MSLSEKNKWEIIFLNRHPYGPKLSINDIARIVKCNRNTVMRWLSCYERTGGVEEKVRSGRPRQTSNIQDQSMIERVSEEPEMTSELISTRMKRKGVQVSSRTVRRRFNEFGFSYSAPLLKPLLTETHQLKRFEWSRKYMQFDWNKVIFSDETTVHMDRPPSRVWQRRGARFPFSTVKHPQKLHLWGCFCSQGFGEIFMFGQNLNSELLCKIYEKALLPSAANWMDDWILQEDNDPKHMSKFSKKWKEKHNVQRLPWPPQSPDLNPIENVWKILKCKLRTYQPRTIVGMKKKILKIWRQLSIDYAENLVNSMPSRLEACISSNGGYTPY